MLMEKSFLNDIFHSNHLTTATILAGATNFQINLLLRIVHFITKGDIPLSSESLTNLKNSRKAHFLNKNFKQRSMVKKLLTKDRRAKIAILMNIHKFLPSLLQR